MTNHATTLCKKPAPLNQVKIILTGKQPALEQMFKEVLQKN